MALGSTFLAENHRGRQTPRLTKEAAQHVSTEQSVDKGFLGAQAGRGYYSWPNPSFAAADFLDVPDISKVPEIVSLVMPH